MSEPKTWAEKLDAAGNGQEFKGVLDSLFFSLATAMNNEMTSPAEEEDEPDA